MISKNLGKDNESFKEQNLVFTMSLNKLLWNFENNVETTF